MFLERNAAMVISAATHTSINISKKKESVNMCKAIEEMLTDAKAECENLGLAQYLSQGCSKAISNFSPNWLKMGILDIKKEVLNQYFLE